MSEKLSSRPEAPWALWTGIAGGLAAAIVSVMGILKSGSSTAAIGFIFVPFVAAIAAIPAGIWGLALGHVWLHQRGVRHSSHPALLAAAWVFALAVPAVIGWETWRGLELERAVLDVSRMDGRRLDEAFERSPLNRDKYFLGAIVQNVAASAALLDRIAALPGDEYYEVMGSFWNVTGANRKGLALMRLVAYNPNVSPATLERLATGPHADKVLHDVLRNPATPMKVLEPHVDSTNYLVEWGLALNPNTPPAVMERLSRSKDLYTRMNLTYNKATPPEILQRLAQDPDEILARNARQALDRRAAGKK
jgi:hypothetical protein